MPRTFAWVVLGGAVGAWVLVPQPSRAVCSVFSHHPCVYYPYHQVCSVFRRHACTPEALFPFSQQLQLTIESSGATPPSTQSGAEPENGQSGTEPKKLNTIRDVFTALRHCWVPPAEDQVSPGMQLSVRLSFKRNGEPIGEPRLTYVTPGISERDRQNFRRQWRRRFIVARRSRLPVSLGGRSRAAHLRSASSTTDSTPKLGNFSPHGSEGVSKLSIALMRDSGRGNAGTQGDVGANRGRS
jgi:hypothetical protein